MEEHPEYPPRGAFRQLCSYAQRYVDTPRFVLWASDSPRLDEAHMLRVLASLDLDAFFRWWPLDDGGDDLEPPLLALPSTIGELVDA
jgi:hypothetical protein